MQESNQTQIMTIKITNLRLRAIIGIFDWEREHKQDIVINLKIKYNAQKAAKQDNIKLALDYKNLCKKIINFVETSSFNLLETLCEKISKIIFDSSQVIYTKVSIDKPQALRFTDSVAVEYEKENIRKPSNF